MIQGKYVMSSAGPILFPDTFNHSDFWFAKPVSAGRFSIVEEGDFEVSVYVFGDSFSLGLKPREGDAAIIKRLFGLSAVGATETEILR